MPGRQPVRGMGREAQQQLPNLVRRASAGHFLRQSLSRKLQEYPGKQTIVLSEGTFVLIRDFELEVDNVTIIGQGCRNTIIRLENEAKFLWSGDNGSLRDVGFDGVTTGAPRTAGYLLRFTGDNFSGERIRTENGHQVIEATGDEHVWRDVRVEGQSNVGFLSTGDRTVATEIRVAASAVGQELQINGDDCYAPGLYCIGGGINIGGLNTYSPAGSQWV